MTDFSSGDGTSTSDEKEKKGNGIKIYLMNEVKKINHL